MSDGTDLSQIQETPPKLDAPREVQEAAEARQALDRTTLEPAAEIQEAQEISISEDIQAAFTAAVDRAGLATLGGQVLPAGGAFESESMSISSDGGMADREGSSGQVQDSLDETGDPSPVDTGESAGGSDLAAEDESLETEDSSEAPPPPDETGDPIEPSDDPTAGVSGISGINVTHSPGDFDTEMEGAQQGELRGFETEAEGSQTYAFDGNGAVAFNSFEEMIENKESTSPDGDGSAEGSEAQRSDLPRMAAAPSLGAEGTGEDIPGDASTTTGHRVFSKAAELPIDLHPQGSDVPRAAAAPPLGVESGEEEFSPDTANAVIGGARPFGMGLPINDDDGADSSADDSADSSTPPAPVAGTSTGTGVNPTLPDSNSAAENTQESGAGSAFSVASNFVPGSSQGNSTLGGSVINAGSENPAVEAGSAEESHASQDPAESSPGKAGKSDFGEQSADPGRHYSAVEMAQGEVAQDSDWNESTGEEPEDPIPAGEEMASAGASELKENLAPFQKNLDSLREMVAEIAGDTGGSLAVEAAPEPTLQEGVVTEGLLNQKIMGQGEGQAEGSSAGSFNVDLGEGAGFSLGGGDGAGAGFSGSAGAEAGSTSAGLGLGLDAGMGISAGLSAGVSAGAETSSEGGEVDDLMARLGNLEATRHRLEMDIAMLRDFIAHHPPGEIHNLTIHTPTPDGQGGYRLVPLTMPMDVAAANNMLTQLENIHSQIMGQIGDIQSQLGSGGGGGGVQGAGSSSTIPDDAASNSQMSAGQDSTTENNMEGSSPEQAG